MLIKRWHKGRKCFVYDVRLFNEHGKREYYPFGHTSKKLAKEYEHKLHNEISEKKKFPERFNKAVTIKFNKFVPEYLKKHASKKRSFRDYVSITKKLVSFFGEFNLHEIGRYQIQSYYSARSEVVGVCMCNREIAILKGIFTKAVEWDFLSVNPVKGFKLAKESPRFRYLNSRERPALIEASTKEPKASYLRDMIMIDLNTGLRKTELLRLQKTHINLEQNILTVEDGKGGKTRFIPINETAREIFQVLLKKKRGIYVFSDRYGRCFKDIKKSFHSAVKRAGLDDVRFHDLRRTFGTLCAYNNVPPKTLQNWMGHASIETTMKYYVVSPQGYEQEAIRRLDGKLTDI